LGWPIIKLGWKIKETASFEANEGLGGTSLEFCSKAHMHTDLHPLVQTITIIMQSNFNC